MADIRVAIAGIRGKMGQEVARSVAAAPGMELVAGIDRRRAQDGEWSDGPPLFTDAQACCSETRPDVLVDFTHREAAIVTVEQAIAQGVRPVIGTTGFAPQELKRFSSALEDRGIGGLYAPNFAVGALLMMRFAAMAARYLSAAEIVEYHHDRKRDAPSGTARMTAQRMAAAMRDERAARPAESAPRSEHSVESERFHLVEGVPVHSVRLPGLVAHQEVLFGGEGELLTIRHDSLGRHCFMPGVLLGVRSVMTARGLVEGLEHFLF